MLPDRLRPAHLAAVATYRAGVPALEAAARRAPRRKHDGVTVVAVSYLALDCLQALAFAVERFSPPGTRLLVIDNASGAEVRAWLRQRHWVRSLRLPVNVGHGRAMDLGFALAPTEYVVALDIDAFPIASTWLDVALAPLRDGTAEVSGGGFRPGFVPPGQGEPVVAGYRGEPFVHACFLAMRRARFVERHHTFRSHGRAWDTGERISMIEDRVSIMEPTQVRGPSVVGTVFGDVVYHNFYATRVRKDDRTEIDGIGEDEPGRAWEEAVDGYLRPLPGCPL